MLSNKGEKGGHLCEITKIKSSTMADNDQKARALIAEAEKKLTPAKGFLGSLFGYVIRKKMQFILNFELCVKCAQIPYLSLAGKL